MIADTLLVLFLLLNPTVNDTSLRIDCGLRYEKHTYVRKIDFGPDYFHIVKDYIFTEKNDKYWFRKYKLTIRF